MSNLCQCWTGEFDLRVCIKNIRIFLIVAFLCARDTPQLQVPCVRELFFARNPGGYRDACGESLSDAGFAGGKVMNRQKVTLYLLWPDDDLKRG